MMIGDSVELYRPGLEQVLVGKISAGRPDSATGGALVFLNMFIDQLGSNYELTYEGEELISGNTKTWHLVVRPKVTVRYNSADIWIDADGLPRQARINESNGDTTTVLLSNIQKNVAIDAKTFKLEYPRTVKVIRF